MKTKILLCSLVFTIFLTIVPGYADPWKERTSKSDTLYYIRKYLRKNNVYGFGRFIPSADPDNHID